MPNPSHMSKDLLEKLQNIADFTQVNVSRGKLLASLGDRNQKKIESIIQENIAVEDAKRLLNDDQEK